MNVKTAVSFSGALALVGCGTQVPLSVVSEPVPQYQVEATSTIKLSAIGYGASSSFDGHTAGQRRLLAMRASRLDAYRALAEQVHGIRLTGNTTVSALMSQNDSFRVYIDSYLRGAKVVNINPMADGNYETTIEIDFDDRIARPYLTPAPAQPTVRTPTYVVQPVTPTGVAQPTATQVVIPRRSVDDGLKGTTGPGRMYGTSFYYAE